MTKAKNYRPDINALRALAVVLVLLFHFFPTFFPGGYLGVDIFFVISGYLMFSVIEFGLKRHQFSVAVFYKKRILRILPALACMIAIVLIFAYFLLFSSQFESAVKESLSASLFVSNYYYFSLADYFDSGAYEKLFLHTWTLGVEFQFYLTFPLLLILCSYLDSSKAKFIVLVTVCFLSFVFSEYAFSRNASFAFYDVTSRYWEFLLGAIAASTALDTKVMPRIYLGLCICAIVLSVLLHNMLSDIAFFLKFTLVVATAVLIAFCNSQLWLVKNKAVQHIGTFSYSIYLWHWPIACLLVSFGYESMLTMVAGLISSLVIGGLSFKYIEKSLKTGFSLFALVLILSVTYIISPDFKVLVNGEGSKQDQFIERYRAMKIDPDGLFGKCNLVNVGSDIDEGSLIECLPGFEKSVFVWGDSQAASLVPGLKKTAESFGFRVSQLTTAGCPVSLHEINSSDPRALACNHSNQLALAQIALKKPSVVLISQRFGLRDDDYLAVAKYVSQHSDHVVMVGPFPEWSPSLPLVLAKRHDIQDVEIADLSFNATLAILNDKLAHTFSMAGIEHVSYIDVINNLCHWDSGNRATCTIRKSPHEDLFFFDYGHLSAAGSTYFVTDILEPKVGFLGDDN